MDRGSDRRSAVASETTLRSAKADFEGIVVVCAKCAKRQGLAKREFGRTLKSVFKRETRGRRIRVVETGCLGPCPKRMIAVATPVSMLRRRVVLMDPTLPPATIRGLLLDLDLGLDAASDRATRTIAGRRS